MSTDAQAHTAFATGYRADIDGLRAIAVLAVIFFHARFWPFSGGFVGVDVFFVISGFLITSIIKKEVDRNDFSLARFYERRIRRIFPALFFVLLAVTPLALAVLLPVETLRFGQTVVSTALFVANVYFWRNAGYFAPDAERNPLLHTWSLAVEEQFYIVFPIFLLILLRFGRRGIAMLALGAVLVASLAIADWQLAVRPDAVFYLLPTRTWELSLGAVLALGRWRAPSSAVAAAAGAFGLAMIAATVVLYTPYTTFPGLAAVPPCAATALVLYAGQRGDGIVSRALSYGPVRFVGKISYSLYLWHLPPLVLARIYLDRELKVSESLALIAASAAVAAFSWKFVETPFRRPGTADVRWRVIGLGVTASLVFSALGAALVASGGVAARFAPEVVTADAAQVERDYPATCLGPNAGDGAPCAASRFEILVWGDSHAAHYFAGIERRAAAAGLTAQLQWAGGCPPVLDAVPVTMPVAHGALRVPASRFDDRCAALNDEILALIRSHPGIATVALAGAWDFWSEGVDIGTNEQRYLARRGSREIGVDESRRVLRTGLERTMSELRGLGLQVVVLGQVPDNVKSPSQCTALAHVAGTGVEACARPRAAALQRSAWSSTMLREIGAAHAAAVFEPAERLCAGASCLIEWGGKPLYRDADHLSPEGSALLGDALPAAIFGSPRSAASESGN